MRLAMSSLLKIRTNCSSMILQGLKELRPLAKHLDRVLVDGFLFCLNHHRPHFLEFTFCAHFDSKSLNVSTRPKGQVFPCKPVRRRTGLPLTVSVSLSPPTPLLMAASATGPLLSRALLVHPGAALRAALPQRLVVAKVVAINRVKTWI